MHSLPQAMRAAWIDQRGSADDIRVESIAVPAYGPTDVLVQVHYVAANPIDTFVRSGRYMTPLPFPFIVGRDLVGRVVAVGAGVTDFTIGDPVWANSLGHAGRQGCSAQYAVVAADRLYPLPAGVDPLTAIGVLHPAASAYLAITTHAQTAAGETVYIAGGAGHVGGAAVVMASRAGARVIASAAAADHDYCKSLGADIVLDYRDERLTEKIGAAAPGGVDVHLDTSARHDLDAAVGLLAPRGRVILMAGLGARPLFPVGALYTRDAKVMGFAISNASTADLLAASRSVNQLLESGALAPRATEVHALEHAAQVHQRLESGDARGLRLILQV